MNGGPPGFVEGCNRDVTVLTVRIFNHAELREAVEPGELIEMTSLFLQHSGEFLTERGAYLDESSPDCVRVFFGVIDDQPDHHITACEAAMELRQRLSNLNAEFESRFFHRLQYGVAISRDPMTLGIYESENAVRLSAVGEVLEFVRKLSVANGDYGSQILISSSLYSLIRENYAVRPMEMVYDAHEDLMTEVYELIDRKDRLTEEEEESRQAFWQAVILYREGKCEDALQIFSDLSARYPTDRPLKFFIGQCQSAVVSASGGSSKDVESNVMRGHARVLNSL